MRHARPVVAAAAACAAVALSACGSSGGSSGGSAAASPAPAASVNAADKGTLSGVCPSTVVIQTDWNPESEHGALYQLVGPNPSIDTGKKRVTGELMAQGADTGVKVEIRVGGPAIGFQTVSAQMYLDKSITLGYVSTDEAAQFSAKQPTVALVATNEKSPFILMWDPKKHPDFKTIADIGKTDTKVLYFSGATYMDYLTSHGFLKKSQVDGSYDGTPANFVSSGGKVAQQGFATAEPYVYAHEIRAWDKPVSYALVADTGYPIYPEAIAARPDVVKSDSACFKKLVPILQQAQIDYVKAPATADKLIVDLVKKYNTGWTYDEGVANYSVATQLKLGIVGNGADSTLGNFDMSRIQKVIDITTPIYAAQHKPVKAGLKPSDLATNEFIDPSIGLK